MSGRAPADHRYAVYFAPAPGSLLHECGTRCLGRDAGTGDRVPFPDLRGVAMAAWDALTQEPRRYGVHATLKPPFRLAAGRTRADLVDAVRSLAATLRPVTIPALRLSLLGDFLALVPAEPAPALSALAERCVRDLDIFRAPAPPDETARRRRARLTPRQDALLATWGYPYVLDEWRFHMTLTGRLDVTAAAAVEAELARLVAGVCGPPVTIADLCLFEQASLDEPFLLTERAALGGRTHAE